jgi:AraC-like DNA-binding protein
MHRWRPPRNAALGPFVHSFEYVEDAPGTEQERMIPGGDVSLVVTLRDDGFSYTDVDGSHRVDGACVAGPQHRAQVVSTAPQRGMVAVNFAPGGAARFLTLPLHAVTDDYPSLAAMWGRAGAVVRERLVDAPPARVLDLAEAILLEQVVAPLTRDLALELAIRALDRGAPVGAVVERFGTTAKPFIRRFRAAIGLTPKAYARLRRLQRLLQALPAAERSPSASEWKAAGGVGGRPPSRLGPVDWARAATEHGYYDQSHLVHDFRTITGITPSAYRPRSADAPNHLPV